MSPGKLRIEPTIFILDVKIGSMPYQSPPQ